MPYMNCIKDMKLNSCYTVNENKLHSFSVIRLFQKVSFPWVAYLGIRTVCLRFMSGNPYIKALFKMQTRLLKDKPVLPMILGFALRRPNKIIQNLF